MGAADLRSASPSPAALAAAARHPCGSGRLSPYQAGLAAAARPDIHIERVWPMRSPSTGELEESSSAHFQVDLRGTPPARILPVGGLRMSQAFAHEPVMVTEVADLFGPVPAGLVVDATVGGGGHAAALLSAHPGLHVLGVDRDPAALEAAGEALGRFGHRVTLRHARFDQLAELVREVQTSLGTPPEEFGLAGAIFDLGVSSPQFDEAGRGFSYRSDAPLDMRMDPTTGRTAADLVNDSTEDELAALFAANGEGRFARRIARAIVAARPLSSTIELSDVVRAAIPAPARRSGHPARRVFQAIRIEVNEELDQLADGVDQALALLRAGGRCVVIAYHSGEDRLVKAAFTRAAKGNCECPPGLPCVCGAEPEFRFAVRGARRPTGAEVERNHRAEAARLRAVERVAGSPLRSSSDGEVA